MWYQNVVLANKKRKKKKDWSTKTWCPSDLILAKLKIYDTFLICVELKFQSRSELTVKPSPTRWQDKEGLQPVCCCCSLSVNSHWITTGRELAAAAAPTIYGLQLCIYDSGSISKVTAGVFWQTQIQLQCQHWSSPKRWSRFSADSVLKWQRLLKQRQTHATTQWNHKHRRLGHSSVKVLKTEKWVPIFFFTWVSQDRWSVRSHLNLLQKQTFKQLIK